MTDRHAPLKNYDEQRLTELFTQQQFSQHAVTDRMFAWLMAFQWLAGIVVAVTVSPWTWIGDVGTVHHHVWAAVLLGGVISSFPIFLAVVYPGRRLTRHVIAFAQVSWSALLIHLSGGRIETHFHVFGSLAFLAFYRDWRVLVTATVVVATDHFVRGVWFPYSVFGVFVESPYRWIEHAGWVAFEDVILVLSCLRGVRESQEICRRRAILEFTNARIEQQIEQRTAELRREKQRTETANDTLTRNAVQLSAMNSRLSQEIDERKNAEAAHLALHEQLVVSSRIAGMAEVATGVLHNVGNVLNSVNVSANLLLDQLKKCPTNNLGRASALIDQHRDDLGAFFTADARGRHFPEFLQQLAASVTEQRTAQLDELRMLTEHIEHIKEIVNMQQSFAHLQGATESVNLSDLVEHALRLSEAALIRHDIKVERCMANVPPVVTEKHKVLQILVNLIGNAKYALHDSDRNGKRLTLVITGDEGHVCVQVRDNGVGISRENLTKIFSHGFTTRKEGHGFGLHSAALAAQELDGSLSVHSDGPGLGAVFTLRLPTKLEATCAPGPLRSAVASL